MDHAHGDAGVQHGWHVLPGLDTTLYAIVGCIGSCLLLAGTPPGSLAVSLAGWLTDRLCMHVNACCCVLWAPTWMQDTHTLLSKGLDAQACVVKEEQQLQILY